MRDSQLTSEEAPRFDQPVWALDPITRKAVDVRPLFQFLHERCKGRFDLAEQAEFELQRHLANDQGDERPSSHLKRHLSDSFARQMMFETLCSNQEGGARV